MVSVEGFLSRADVRDLVERRREAARIRSGYYDYLPPWARPTWRVRTNLGVASSYPSAAATTPTHLHPVFCHLRSGHRGNVGHVCNIHSFLLEHSSTSGTVVVGHRHIHWRLGDLICRGRLAVAERPYARLSAGAFGLVGSPTLGERGCLALSRSLGLGELLTQLFDRRRKTRNLILLSADQGDQLPVFTGWRVSVCTHSRSIGIYSADRNASAEAANQLRFSECG